MQRKSKFSVGKCDVHIALAADRARIFRRSVETVLAVLPAVPYRRDSERNTAVCFSAPGFVHEMTGPASAVRPVEVSFAMRTRRQRP